MKKSSKDDIGKTFDVEFEKKIFNYLWREMVIVLFIKKNRYGAKESESNTT